MATDAANSLSRLPGEYAVHRLHHDAAVPSAIWQANGFLSVTRTSDELSIVAPVDLVIDGSAAVGPWVLYRVDGSMDFAITGVMWRLTEPLARAGIGILALGTYDTDYVLVPPYRVAEAESAWRSSGWRVSP